MPAAVIVRSPAPFETVTRPFSDSPTFAAVMWTSLPDFVNAKSPVSVLPNTSSWRPLPAIFSEPGLNATARWPESETPPVMPVAPITSVPEPASIWTPKSPAPRLTETLPALIVVCVGVFSTEKSPAMLCPATVRCAPVASIRT